MHCRVALVALTVWVLLVSPAAGTPNAHGVGNGTIVVTDQTPGAPSTGGVGTAQPDHPVYAYWAMVYTAEGFCRERRFTTDEAVADAYNYVYELRVAEANELTRLGDCPKDVTTAPMPPSPGELAREFWDVRRLPSPNLKVVPGYAIVGKRVYLQLVGPARTTFDVANPIGTNIAIEATSRYVVDWGDGSPPVTTTNQGGPWPDGDVTHVYDKDRRAHV